MSTDDLAVAFCGAADNGPFVDKLVERAWEDAQAGTNLDEVCASIETSIKETYREYGGIFQQGYCPSADLIYGVKMFKASKLFSATGPIVVEKDDYYSGGAGYYMADFLASRMYRRNLNLSQCVTLAAYVLFQAKEHVDGCGGASHIAVLRNTGKSGLVSPGRTDAITTLVTFADNHLGRIILASGDLQIDEAQLDEDVKAVMYLINNQRTTITNALASQEGFHDGFYGIKGQRDLLGFLIDTMDDK